MSAEGHYELDVRGIYDALPSTSKLRDPPLGITKSDYFYADTTRNATGRDVFEIGVVDNKGGATHLDVKDITTEGYRQIKQKCFSVGGKYSQKDISPLIPFFDKRVHELGLHGDVLLVRGELAFKALCPYDEITPPKRAVPSIKQAFIDVATLWNQLREYALKNSIR